jgi:hypothetical protein
MKPDRIIRVSAEEVLRRPLSPHQVEVANRIAERQRRGDDSGINYEDIPEFTDEQLAEFRRAKDLGWPPQA